MEYALLPFRRYFDFKGRSRRKEYWLYTLFVTVVSIAISLVEAGLGIAGLFGNNGPISTLFSLATFIPGVAVLVRRLHDTDRSGWWVVGVFAVALLAVFALAGSIFAGVAGASPAGIGLLGGIAGLVVLSLFVTLLIFMCLDGTRGPNRYGPDPKQPTGHLDDVFA